MTRARPGFTFLEITIALAVLAVAMVLIAQVGFQSWLERQRVAARHEAVELAANVLEAARALPWDGLTPEWATGQAIPESAAGNLPGGRLTVRVEPEPGRPLTKRVTVTVAWSPGEHQPALPVELVALFSARDAAAKGGNP